jgi:hypothetical protein
MSKNLTRKGLAFGAGIALVASGFAGLPAQAGPNGPITLLPNGGTAKNATYNSITTAGLTLDAVLDPSLNVIVSSNVERASQALYIIDNPSAADITIVLAAGPTTAGFFLYDATGTPAVAATVDTTETGAFTTAATKTAGRTYVDVC